MDARRAAPLVLILAPLLAAGCSSSRHFPEESKEAEHAIDRAEDAGASEHSRLMLDSARDTLDNARRAEEAAIHDKQAAKEQLHAARLRAEKSEQRLEITRHRKQDGEDQRKAQEIALDRLHAKQDDLHAKGLSDDEVRRLTEMDQTFAKLRLRGIEAELASIDKEQELLDLEKKDAQLDMDAANARVATAEQRLQVARALFERAQEQARLAEAESLEAKRAGLRARVTQM